MINLQFIIYIALDLRSERECEVVHYCARDATSRVTYDFKPQVHVVYTDPEIALQSSQIAPYFSRCFRRKDVYWVHEVSVGQLFSQLVVRVCCSP